MLSNKNIFIKRLFDFLFSFFGLIITSWIILVAWIIASIETKSNGFFIQKRVGRGGKIFNLLKIKTMNDYQVGADSVIPDYMRVTKSGNFLRRTKIDELPQLWNVLKGDMSFVGPRPDIQGYADNLKGDDRVILKIKPGITGPASLKFKNEEEILKKQSDPLKYNNEVIWPSKVIININYIKNWSLIGDLKYIFLTILGRND